MKPNRIPILAITLAALSARSQVYKSGFGDKGCSNEPSFAQNVPVIKDDYIEVHQLQSYGRSPVYTVRVYGNGRVVWHGETAVSVIGAASERVEAATATVLIVKARNQGFGALCDEYVRRAFDGGISVTTVSIGGQTKIVANQGPSNAPPWLYKLHKEVAALPPVEKLIGSKQDMTR